MTLILVSYKIIISKKNQLIVTSWTANQDQTKNIKYDLLEERIIKLSISTCRLWLYLLTSVTILAVDFRIFPRYLAKTENFGVSLMDLGVGFYSVCHAMKIIRNSHSNSTIHAPTDILM